MYTAEQQKIVTILDCEIVHGGAADWTDEQLPEIANWLRDTDPTLAYLTTEEVVEIVYMWRLDNPSQIPQGD